MQVSFVGYVNSTADAAYLVSAASRGMIPRITRRLFSDERLALVKSGSVFVFSVNESCINRWTDGKSWSPTRIKENFLVSREVGHLGTVRVNILFKKTITVWLEMQEYRIVSYFTDEDLDNGVLPSLSSSRPDITSLPLSRTLFRNSKFRDWSWIRMYDERDCGFISKGLPHLRVQQEWPAEVGNLPSELYTSDLEDTDNQNIFQLTGEGTQLPFCENPFRTDITPIGDGTQFATTPMMWATSDLPSWWWMIV